MTQKRRFFFFFSSRRRHTRLVSDWSSDVCSSDLRTDRANVADVPERRRTSSDEMELREEEIGRASCRESVDLGGRRIIKKKKKKKKNKRNKKGKIEKKTKKQIKKK